MLTFIYALVDPKEKNDCHIYVGKSNNPFKRFKSHLKDKRLGYKYYWIQSLLKQNLIPALQIIDQCDDKKVVWTAKEREYISFYKKCGYKVVNETDGGEGGNTFEGKHHSNETKIKISKAHQGKYHSEETKKKISETGKGKCRSDETKIKISDHNGMKLEKNRKKISEALEGRTLSEEWRTKLSKANEGKHHTENSKRKISIALTGKIFSEEHKRKISENNKGKHLFWQGKHRSEETKNNMRHPHKKRSFSEVSY
jgi:hypothetical protein